jgi:hypothetical protein
VLRAAHHGGEQIRPASEESSVPVFEHVGHAWTLGELVLCELPREGPHLVVLKVLRVHEKKKNPPRPTISPDGTDSRQCKHAMSGPSRTEEVVHNWVLSVFLYLFFIIIVLWKCAPWAGRALRTR